MVVVENTYSQTIVQQESLQAVFIETYNDTTPVGTASGFVIKSKGKPFLITNWHVLFAKNARTKAWLNESQKLTPNNVKVVLRNEKGQPVLKSELLVDKNGISRIQENNINGITVDVVALPLSDTTGIVLHPVVYDNPLLSELVLAPTDRLFVVGYPLGLSSNGALPIWKSGLIASEPSDDQEGLPIIWLDIQGYPGQSGSAVFLKAAEFNTKSARNVSSSAVSVFLGVFSHGNSVYGALWKASYLKSFFNDLK